MSLGNGHAVRMSGGLIPLGSWGALEVVGATSVRLETSSGETVDCSGGAFQYLGNAVYWLDGEAGLLLFIPRIGDQILQFELSGGKVGEVDWLVRDEDEGLRFISVRPGPSGVLFILYERGLICLEADGRKRWHSLHDDLSAEYIGIEDGNIILQQQWPPELAGRRHRYRISDGVEVRYS